MLKLQDIFPAGDKPLQKALVFFLALVAFTLPFKSIVNIFIVLALLAWMAGNPFKKLLSNNKFTKDIIAILVFYLLHATAFLYTHNIQESFFSLEIKISLLIFPLIFYTGDYSWPQMKFFIKSFVIGTLVYCIASLLHAGWQSYELQKNLFFYQDLSWSQHPSYLSMYLTFCSVAILQKNIFKKFVKALCLIFFTVFVLMLSSKTGIAIHFLFLLMVGVAHFLKQGSYGRLAIFAVGSAIALCLVVNFVAPVNARFLNVVNAFSSKEIDRSSTESTAVRMLIWKEAKTIIRENPLLGVSPGDANDVLYERYRREGLTGAFDKKLNAHSQYFQTGVGLGLVGLVSLIAIFIFPFFQKPRRLLVFFLLITAVNFLSESMLQTMAGCIFFGYFYAVLCFDKEVVKKEQPEPSNLELEIQ